jgi:hypothetical protein
MTAESENVESQELYNTYIERLAWHIGKINDELTREQITRDLSRISEYRVICDERNNPPDIIDSNALVVDLPELRSRFTVADGKVTHSNT